jgi:carbon-monoxide dehydrogenase medium subunit
VKAAPFAYAKPRALEEALDLAARPNAKVLAGGQSLIPSLNMRLSSPELLVDINGLEELKGIRLDKDTIRIGALTTHAELERSDVVKKHLPLLAAAVPHIAHPAIRNRGTIGGSLALADPAAEYPACVLALDATIIVTGKKGSRKINAGDFFKGLFETALKPGEILTAVEFKAQKKDERSAFLEIARRQGDYATIGLAAFATNGTKRLAYFGAADRAVLAHNAAKAKDLESAKAALAKDLQPPADLYHSSATKLHLARVLLERAWNTL